MKTFVHAMATLVLTAFFSVGAVVDASAIPPADVMCASDGGTWTECGSGCGPLTCENPEPGEICPSVCVPMCICPESAPFWDELSGCISPDSCGGGESSGTGDLCSDTGGTFNECGSGCGPLTCAQPEPQAFCPSVCVPLCECPAIAPIWDEALGCIPVNACATVEPEGCPEGITYEGCCEGNVLKYCEGGEYYELDCQYGCGIWEMNFSFYDCLSEPTQEPYPDPSGVHPLNCSDVNPGEDEEGGEEGSEGMEEDVVDEGDTTDPEPDAIEEEDVTDPVEEDTEEDPADDVSEPQEDGIEAEEDTTESESDAEATTPEDEDTTEPDAGEVDSEENEEDATTSPEEEESDKEIGANSVQPEGNVEEMETGSPATSEELVPVLSTETAPGGCKSGPSPLLGLLSLFAMGVVLIGRRRTEESSRTP